MFRRQPEPLFPDYKNSISSEELDQLIQRSERAMGLLASILEQEEMADLTLDSLGDLSHLETRYPAEFAEIRELAPELISGLAEMQTLVDMRWDLEEWQRLKNTPESPEGIGESPVSSRISGAAFVEGITRISTVGTPPAAPAPLLEFFPHHAMLDQDQRNTYAFWLENWAHGKTLDIYDSYVALRAFEVINGRGWSVPEDGAAELVGLWFVYHDLSPALNVILWRWIEDFIFVHHIEGGLDQLYDSYSRFWITGPFPDHVIQRLLDRPLSQLPLELIEELSGLTVDDLQSVMNDDIDYFEHALKIVLFTLDVQVRATASPAGMLGRISPKKKTSKAAVAFEGALYAGRRAMVERPPAAPYHSSGPIASLLQALMQVVDFEVVRQLDEDAEPIESVEFENDQHRRIAEVVAAAISGYDRVLEQDREVVFGAAEDAAIEDTAAAGMLEEETIDWHALIPEEYHKALDAFDPSDMSGPVLQDRFARIDAADWDGFFGDLTRSEYEVLHTIVNSMFPLSQARAIAKESDRSLNQILRAINVAGRARLGTSIVALDSKQPRLESLVASRLTLELADQLPDY